MCLPDRYALVSAADEGFVLPLRVLLFSFLRRNPWFKGDILIIDCGLTESSRHTLLQLPNLRLIEAAPELKEATQRLGASVPRVREISPRFDKLDLFRWTEHDRLVFLDADILVTGCLKPLFTTTDELTLCLERCSLIGRNRTKSTYHAFMGTPREGTQNLIEREFNTGVMSLGRAWRGPSIFQQTLDLLNPCHWESVVVPGIADQIVFNWLLARHTTPLSHAFNFMPRLESLITRNGNCTWRQARVHHYADAFKPWLLVDPKDVAYHAPELLKYWELWHTEKNRMLADASGTTPDPSVGHAAMVKLLCRQRPRLPNWRHDWRWNRRGQGSVRPPNYTFTDDLEEDLHHE